MMGTGALLLGAITLVVIVDTIMAFRFRTLADRAENGDPSAQSIDPANLRKVATAMFIMAPLIWLAVALISFGVIQTHGIDPIKFQAE